MKSFKILVIIGLTFISGCDFLDVVPDNIATVDNAFTTRNNAEKYLFTCYSFLPDHADFEENPALISGDEIWFFYPAKDFDEDAWEIARGNQKIVDPYINYWDGENHAKPLYQGIRECNIFLENIDKVPDLDDYERIRWIAEAKFLKAYYHFWLLRMYGPIPLVKENLSVSSGPEEVRIKRAPVDSCFSYIVKLLDESAQDLPDHIKSEVSELGRVTKTVALSVKARVLAEAASPLFNGNTEYAGFTGPDGDELFNQEYDPDKWKKAADAAKEAINMAQSMGHKLYYYSDEVGTYAVSDSIQIQMGIRNAVAKKWNPEVIWGNTNSMADNIQRFAQARMFNDVREPRAMYAPPIKIAELFYSEHGVPIEEDKTWDYENRFELKTATQDERYYLEPDYQTAALHFDREPRFYADLAFDGAAWYGQSRYDDDNPWYVQAKAGQNAARSETSNYSVTGYWAKKLVNYQNVPESGGDYTIEEYPWPVIRLADLYLLYAEALNEVNGPNAEAYKWINLVRKRAGLESVEDSWSNYSRDPNKYQSKDGLREIIHRERLIEMAFEGDRFWDLRRWKEAPEVLNSPIKGWDIEQETAKAYYRPKTLFNQVFRTKDYFWPISEEDMIVNDKLVQNPGW